jgi:hypothetical protein
MFRMRKQMHVHMQARPGEPSSVTAVAQVIYSFSSVNSKRFCLIRSIRLNEKLGVYAAQWFPESAKMQNVRPWSYLMIRLKRVEMEQEKNFICTTNRRPPSAITAKSG